MLCCSVTYFKYTCFLGSQYHLNNGAFLNINYLKYHFILKCLQLEVGDGCLSIYLPVDHVGPLSIDRFISLHPSTCHQPVVQSAHPSISVEVEGERQSPWLHRWRVNNRAASNSRSLWRNGRITETEALFKFQSVISEKSPSESGVLFPSMIQYIWSFFSIQHRKTITHRHKTFLKNWLESSGYLLWGCRRASESDENINTRPQFSFYTSIIPGKLQHSSCPFAAWARQQYLRSDSLGETVLKSNKSCWILFPFRARVYRCV